jgi:chromosome segregation ATPase
MESETKGPNRTRPIQPRRAAEGTQDKTGLEVVERGAALEAVGTDATSATSGPGSATPERTVASETRRDLQRVNKELQVRIRELELQLTGSAPTAEGEAADYGELSEESSSVITIIKDLHRQIDAARELNEALEADLATLKEKLAAEQTARAEVEARIKLLEAKAALGEQLREDLSFVEEERNEIARRLEEATSQVARMTAERDRLAAQKITDEARLKELQGEKIALEVKVLNLEETVADLDRLRQEVSATREEAQRLKETVQGLKGKLEATELAKDALDLDLTTARELVRKHSGQIEELNANLTTAHTQLDNLRAGLDKHEIENAHLVESNRRAERELKILTERLEFAKKDLDLSRKALRAIRAAAMRTTGPTQEHASEA